VRQQAQWQAQQAAALQAGGGDAFLQQPQLQPRPPAGERSPTAGWCGAVGVSRAGKIRMQQALPGTCRQGWLYALLRLYCICAAGSTGFANPRCERGRRGGVAYGHASRWGW